MFNAFSGVFIYQSLHYRESGIHEEKNSMFNAFSGVFIYQSLHYRESGIHVSETFFSMTSANYYISKRLRALLLGVYPTSRG